MACRVVLQAGVESGAGSSNPAGGAGLIWARVRNGTAFAGPSGLTSDDGRASFAASGEAKPAPR